jgi:hypothetical protein
MSQLIHINQYFSRKPCNAAVLLRTGWQFHRHNFGGFTELQQSYQVHNASKLKIKRQSEEMFFNSFAQIVQSEAAIYLQD